MDLKHLYHIKHPTSCHGRCRAPGCFVVLILCFSVFSLLIGWGGVGWDVNIHVHVTLMILCWSWGVGFPKKLPQKRALVTWGPTPQWMWRRTKLCGNNSEKLTAMSKWFHGWSRFWEVKKQACKAACAVTLGSAREPLKTTRRLSAPFLAS